MRMQTVMECDILGMDFHTYRKQPKWWIELLIRKKIADNEFRSKNK